MLHFVTILLFIGIPSASAGELVIDARVATDITIDGKLRAKLYDAGVVRLQVDAGTRAVTLYVDGRPQKVDILVPETGAAQILVGRTGITTSGMLGPVATTTATNVEFQSAGQEPLQVQIDDERHNLDPGHVLAVALDAGNHRLSVRDGAGTTIWARGTLALSGGDLVVQLAEGRMPETSGEGGAFRPDGR